MLLTKINELDELYVLIILSIYEKYDNIYESINVIYYNVDSIKCTWV